MVSLLCNHVRIVIVMERRGEQWWVCPAQRPQDLGLPEKGGYLKVKDRSIPNGALPHLVRFNQPGYQPQYHEVSFNTGTGRGKQGAYVQITYIGPRGGQGKYKGVLICSGNMAETSAGSSKRKNYVLVLEANPKAKTIIIPAQVVKDYVDSLTEFQKEAPFDERGGCLVAGRPVFYLEANGEVIAFGHTPNFRLPAWLSGSKPRRAATPLDFVPAALRNPEHTDLAEALFGYVEDTKEVQREVARAGRVCVTDAQLQPGQGNVWVSAQPITPKILGSPKPTTFQHYLVQTEPNDKKSLRHYASPTPAETVIRGHKLYWHKPNLQRSDWEESPTKIKSGAEDRQHTNIKPVRAGVQFRFRIYFEDLDDRELGALVWLLKIAAADGYRFKLGMGKPLGLGSIKLNATLHLTDRAVRYTQLFATSAWATGESASDAVSTQAQQAFEQWILSDKEINPKAAQRLEEVERVKMLLFLLQWPGPDKSQTRYLEIEHPQNDNEYKNRPVLPTPAGVIKGSSAQSPVPFASGSPTAKPLTSTAPTPPQHPTTPPPPTPSTPKLAPVTPTPATVKRPTTVEEIQEGDLLEGKVIAVDANRIRLDLSVPGIVGTMGLTQLDDWVRRDTIFHEYWEPGKPRPNAQFLQQEGALDIAIKGKMMQVQVQRVKTEHGKTQVQVKFVEWLR